MPARVQPEAALDGGVSAGLDTQVRMGLARPGDDRRPVPAGAGHPLGPSRTTAPRTGAQ